MGIEGTMLKLDSGEEIIDKDFLRIVEEAKSVDTILNSLPPQYPKNIIEQAILSGAFIEDQLELNLQTVANTNC